MAAPIKSKQNRPGVGVGVIVTSKSYPGCVLLGKRTGTETGVGKYALPGGHLEFGESWEECAVRETQEETGLQLVNVTKCTVMNVIDREAGYHYIEIFMQGEVDEAICREPVNTEPDKCEGWSWFKWDQLPSRDLMFVGLIDLIDSGYQPFR